MPTDRLADSRNPILETAISAIAGTSRSAFIYYPKLKSLWLPASVAGRLGCPEWVADVPLTQPFCFVTPESLSRYKRLFQRIDDGEDYAEEIFLTDSVFQGMILSFVVAERDAYDEAKTVVCRLIPTVVRNAYEYSAQTANTAVPVSKDIDTDPLLSLATAVTSQYQAIFSINLAEHTFRCYQDKNAELMELFGRNGSYDAVFDAYIRSAVVAEDRAFVRQFAEPGNLALALAKTDRLCCRFRRTDIGLTLAVFTVTERDENRRPMTVFVTLSDVSREVNLVSEKTSAASAPAAITDNDCIDPLTGLLSERAYRDLLEHPEDYAEHVGFLIFDIDHFWAIKQKYGTEVADTLLVRTAGLLKSFFRTNDLMIRLGEDQFGVLLQDCMSDYWSVIVHKLPLMSMGVQRILPDGQSVSMSAGISFSLHGFSETLFTNVCRALSHVKSIGRAGCSQIDEHGNIIHTWRDPFAPAQLTPDNSQLFELAGRAFLSYNDRLVFLKNRDSVYLACSESFARKEIGLSCAADIVGKTDLDLFADQGYASKYRKDDADMMRSGETITRFHEERPDNNGKFHDCITTKIVLKAPDGQPAGILGITRDMPDSSVSAESSGVSEAGKPQSAAYEALIASYLSVNLLNLQTLTYRVLRAPSYASRVMEAQTDLRQGMQLFVERFVAPTHADTVRRFFELSTLRDRLQGFTHIDCEYLSRLTGRCFRMSFIPVSTDASGQILDVLFTVTQLDEHAAARHRETQRFTKRYQSLVDQLPGAFIVLRHDGKTAEPLCMSKRFVECYGEDLTQTRHSFDLSALHPDDAGRFLAEFDKMLSITHSLDCMVRCFNKSIGAYTRFKVTGKAVMHSDGTQLLFLLFSDVTELAESEAKLQYASEHDPLTGLYNRRKLASECRRLLREYPDEQFAMLHFDIRQFRLYNTFFGEKAGDRLLCYIADRFRSMEKDYDFIAYGRIEADVFGLFFPIRLKKHQHHLDDLLNSLQHYREDCLIEPVIGIYHVTDRSIPVEAMFARATTAAKQVKSGSDRHVMFFDEVMENGIDNTKTITNEMQPALDAEQFKVWLQPKVELRTGRIVAAEALVRWEHPDRGLIRPDLFIPVFEGNGFITKLDRYMWEQTCRLLKRRKDEGKTQIPISVNVSRISMYSQTTVAFLKALVQKYGIDPYYLQLELTESALMDDPEEMTRELEELRAFGFKLLIDDFGKGYSSLTSLKDLPADVIKLDISLLPQSKDDKKSCAVASSVIRMCRELGLAVIAEGVETQAQADYLISEECPYAQGYLYARPMTVDDCEALLQQQNS